MFTSPRFLVFCAPLLAITASQPSAPTNLTCARSKISSVTLVWDPLEGVDLFDVELSVNDSKSKPIALETTGSSYVEFGSLLPGIRYFFKVRAHAAHAKSYIVGWSDFSVSINCSTTPGDREARGIPARTSNQTRFQRVFRWSEGTHLVDWLAGHNTGDLVGESVYATESSHGDDGLVSAGGDDWLNSTFTEYCVELVAEVPLELLAAPTNSKLRPWADYLSCNVLGNSGSLNLYPKCKCQIIADRLIAHNREWNGSVRSQKIGAVCAPYDPTSMHHPYTVCNCTDHSMDLSQRFVGRQPVYFPFLKDSHYISPDLQPNASLTSAGWWFSHPAGGRCADGQQIGDANGEKGATATACTWRRLSQSRMISVRQLYEHGLNRTVVDPANSHDVPVAQMLQNAKVFQQTFDALAKWLEPLQCPE
jgi:hypothetical protein